MRPRQAKPRQRSIRVGEREIVAIGSGEDFWSDFSHRAMTTSWPAFITGSALAFVLINALFALAYLLGDMPVTNVAGPDFLQYFFFSIETLATVGYGDMHPQSTYGHVIASLESFTGLFGVALLTGLIFSRFSRPHARILFARNPVISTYDGQPVIMLRLANERHNAIGDATAKFWYLRRYTTSEGHRFVGFIELKLLRSENPTFQLSWTLLHIIDDASPLSGLTPQDIERDEGRFMLSINGLDETSAQTVHARKQFSWQDLRWNHRYADILTSDGNRTALDYGRFHDTVPENGPG